MEVRNLITFLKIIETGSFSKAAEQLTYSQSTVTVQIQQLEEEIGVQLFDRIVLPDILREYHCAHPKVDIIVKTADNVFFAERMLSQNEVDLAFVVHDQRRTKNFIKTILKEAHYVFVAAPTRPLTKKPVVTLAEIAENDVIITNQQFYFSDMSNEYTKNTLAYLIKPRFDLWNPIAAMDLAKLDCGIALLASYLVEDAVKKGELCTLNVPELDFTVWLQVLRHEQKAVTPQMSAFYKLLREYYKK